MLFCKLMIMQFFECFSWKPVLSFCVSGIECSRSDLLDRLVSFPPSTVSLSLDQDIRESPSREEEAFSSFITILWASFHRSFRAWIPGRAVVRSCIPWPLSCRWHFLHLRWDSCTLSSVCKWPGSLDAACACRCSCALLAHYAEQLMEQWSEFLEKVREACLNWCDSWFPHRFRSDSFLSWSRPHFHPARTAVQRKAPFDFEVGERALKEWILWSCDGAPVEGSHRELTRAPVLCWWPVDSWRTLPCRLPIALRHWRHALCFRHPSACAGNRAPCLGAAAEKVNQWELRASFWSSRKMHPNRKDKAAALPQKRQGNSLEMKPPVWCFFRSDVSLNFRDPIIGPLWI